MSNNVDNKRIANNTFFLYIRLLLTMVISFITSRVILNTLGEVDFGIYNIVGGIVVLFSFLNATLSTATQRFISFELGSGNTTKVHHVFSISMTFYFIITAILIFLSETIGLWFLNSQMNIPDNRMYAANWVYQFSVLTFIANILRVPYSASIIAYEKMNFYSYCSIIEIVIKLLIVYALYLSSYDKLIVYSILMFISTALITYIYKYYSNNNIATTHYSFILDKDLGKKIISFSGWSILGSFANLSTIQCLNILLNIFFGVVVNAAIGIANQITSAVYQFVSNFQLAFNPQIIKSYAANEMQRFQELVFCSSKISYYLLLIISIPTVVNIDFILKLWLGNVPTYTSEFVFIILIYMCIDSVSSPLWLSAQAKGNIKIYQITLSSILLLNIPLAYIALKMGLSPIAVWSTRLFINILSFVYRCYYVHKNIRLNIKLFFRTVIIRISIVTILSVPIPLYITYIFNGWLCLIFSSIISLIVSLLTIYIVGLNNSEKRFATDLIKSKLRWK